MERMKKIKPISCNTLQKKPMIRFGLILDVILSSFFLERKRNSAFVFMQKVISNQIKTCVNYCKRDWIY